jgi:hypothetical protein
MPRYYFHILRPDCAPVLDDQGAEFEDYEAAQSEAVASVRDLVADAVRRGNQVNGLGIEIVDEDGKVLRTVGAGEVFD